MTKTGYIGLGNIGKPMCSNLVKNAEREGLSVMVYDVVPEPVQEMVELGAEAAPDLKSLTQVCELIGVCVRDDNDVNNLLYGAEGLLENAQPGTIVAIHSTVTRDNVLKWADDGRAKNIHIIDAPITGGAQGAADGNLCIMVGAEAEVLERARPMFNCTSKAVVHGGGVGSGIVLKLANNLMNYAAFAAIAEGVALVRKAGVDPEDLYAVGRVNGVVTPMMHQFSTGREGMLANCSAEEMQQIFGPFVGLAEKDLDHALALAKQHELSLELTEQVRRGISDTFLKNFQ